MKKIYAFLMMAAAMVACMQMEQPMPTDEQETPQAQEEKVQTYTMTVKATKSGDGETKALSLTGKTLNATWAQGEVVEVYQSDSKIGELTAAASEDASTTLSGTFANAPSTSADLTFYFHTADSPSYSGQDGTLEKIATTYDFCAPATVSAGNFSVNNTTKEISVPGGISFGANRQAIVKFTLINKANETTRLNPTNFSFSYGSGVVSLTNIPNDTYEANGDGILYMAIPGFDASAINLSASVGATAFSYSKSGISFADGKYYEITVKMTENEMLATPLTLEAMADGTTVSIRLFQNNTPSLEYRINDGDWTTISFTSTGTNSKIATLTPINNGDKISFRGSNTTLVKDINASCKFDLSDNCYLYGNVMSLLDKDNYSTNTTITGDYAFYQLFITCPIYSHPTQTLLLPATTLTKSCYENMFTNYMGTSHLTTAPVLPATTLAEACYKNMFSGVTTLTSAPALPATTLAPSCYRSMFSGCANLSMAPVLPAETLAVGCYQYMFSECISLSTAPNLPATTLASGCYEGMFYGCSNLNNVTCLATNISASYCTYYWLNGVAATGTFTKAASTDWSGKTGTSGIPSGWTAIPVIPGAFSISNTEKVYFSQGNLQATYNGSAWSWAFAEHQWDYIGNAAGNTSINGNGTASTDYVTVDLFGWVGNSSSWSDWGSKGAVYGISNSTTASDYGTGGSEALKSDWGNAIGTGWRTLTSDEWAYLLNTRSTTSGVRYAKATVNSVNGVILLPDNWSTSYYNLSSTNTSNAQFTSNSITLSDWTTILEAHGAIFLPAAGYREGTSVNSVGSYGYYWSSSSSDDTKAYWVRFSSGNLVPQDNQARYTGGSVRLVRDAN